MEKLIDEKMNRTELKERIGVSTTTFAKLGKNEKVSMDVIERICKELKCNIGDIVDYIGE
ncbi:MAG: helix-turn-helix transcriptional regulator [Anaerovoracaceae bacterium]